MKKPVAVVFARCGRTGGRLSARSGDLGAVAAKGRGVTAPPDRTSDEKGDGFNLPDKATPAALIVRPFGCA